MSEAIPPELEKRIKDAIVELNAWVHSKSKAGKIATSIMGITDVRLGVTELMVRIAVNYAPPPGDEKKPEPMDVTKMVDDLVTSSMAEAKAKGQPTKEAKPKSKRKKGGSDAC